MQDLTAPSPVYDFHGNPITVIMRDGEPWFVAKEVCAILEIKNNRDAISALDDDEKDTVAITDGTSGNPNHTIISESGLYALAFKSRKPEAKTFRKWVTSEVLPSIRKTGGYMVARPDETPEELALRAMQVMHATIERQKAELAIVKPKAIALDILAEKDGNYCISNAAKTLGIQPSKLFEYLSNNNWIYRRGGQWVAYQPALLSGYMTHKLVTVSHDSGEREYTQARITQKGIVRLSKLFVNQEEEA